MPRGAPAQYLREIFGQKKNFTVYSREKDDHYHIQKRHNDLFFPITIFFKENVNKNWPEKGA